jgi:putative intracellular protease/amidase
MDSMLAGKKIALLVANGFEETDMTELQRALLSVGAGVQVVSPEQALVNGWHGEAWGHYFPVDGALSSALAADFDAVIVPGGFRSIEKLSTSQHTGRFVKGFLDAEKPTVLIGDASSLLATLERAEGRKVIAGESVAQALREAGATVEAESNTLVDGNLMTVRSGLEGDDLTVPVMAHLAGTGADVAEAA